jgi:hypothetical protein
MAICPTFLLSISIFASLPIRTNSVVLAKAKLTECAHDGTGNDQCTSRGVIVTLALHNEQVPIIVCWQIIHNDRALHRIGRRDFTRW